MLDGGLGAGIRDVERRESTLVERRRYKSPMGGDEAYGILKGMGDKLDVDLVRAFRPIADLAGTGAAILLH